MVATVIVSIGLFGLCELILASLREGSAALTRTHAVYLVGDIMERIRANPDARDAYDCATYAGAPAERGCASSDAPANLCTARELAEDDLARWQRQACETLSLPGTGACEANVSYVAETAQGQPSRYVVEVLWLQRGDAVPVTLGGELLVSGRSPT
jgi:type IV pilus modification protein PilV